MLDDWTKPLAELPRYHCYVTHKQIVGEPMALAMNAEILRKIANPDRKTLENPDRRTEYLSPEAVADSMASWLFGTCGPGVCGWSHGVAVTPSGKNYGTFDHQFLKRLPGYERELRLPHRVWDPAPYFVQPGDLKLPDSKTCYEAPDWTAKSPTRPSKMPSPSCG